MKCKSTQFYLSGYVRDELSQSLKRRVEAHLRQCAECEAALGFHRRLDGVLSVQVDTPRAPLEHALDLMRHGSQQPRPWLAAKLGDIPLRKTLLTTACAVGALSTVLMLVPTRAHASGPKELFRRMKAAYQSNQSQIEIVVDVKFEDDGSVSVKPVVTNPGAQPTTLRFSGVSVDGSMTLTGTIDLDESHYKSINYGKGNSSLVLVPDGKGKKVEVIVEPKTKLPKTWTSFQWDTKQHKYVPVSRYAFQEKKK